MIKIEITDPHTLDKKVLEDTAMYLLALSGEVFVGVGQLGEFQAEPMDIIPLVDPTIEVLDDSLIEEEFIPVPPEVVNPSPAEIFNPVNHLPSMPVIPVPKAELDTQGFPWDIRIHARTKTKMKDGSWKKLRGVGPNIVKQVEAELQAVQSLPVPAATGVIPAAPSVAGVIPPVPVPPAVAGFSDLMAIVTKAITEGKLRRDQVTEIITPLGIPSLPLLATRLDLIPTVIIALNEVINGAR